MLYALGALDQFDMLYEFATVRLFIHQPRLHHVSEWSVSVDDLRQFGERAQNTAASVITTFAIAQCEGVDTLPPDSFTPGDKQCRFCKARGLCTSEKQHNLSVIADDFIDLTQPLGTQLTNAPARINKLDNEKLAEIYSQLDRIESWCEAVRSRVSDTLKAGQSIPGFKLVSGRQGNRAWSNESDVEEMLKTFRLKQDQIYTQKLISPAQAKTLLKEESPRRWAKLESLIIRSDGKPTVVPDSDPRPALDVNPINDFEDVSDDAFV